MGEPVAVGTEGTRLALCFGVGDALCAFDAERVQELVRVGSITAVHRAPEHVLGIMNLRGRIVTVMDLRLRLGAGRTETSEESRILIVEWKGEHVGLLLERQAGVAEWDGAALQAPPENVSARFGSMLRGVFGASGRLIALLDVDPVMAADEPAAGP